MMRSHRGAGVLRVFVVSATLLLCGCAGLPKAADSSAEALEISNLLADLTLRQRIGQRFIGWVPRDGFSGEVEELVRAGEIGGFIIYKWNFNTIEDVRELTGTMQHAAVNGDAGIPLFIAADQEGGRVAAFRFDEFVLLPAPFHLSANLSAQAVEAAAYVNAVQLRSVGVNMNLAPVLDLYPFPDKTIIGDRSFGPDEETVTAAGVAFVRGTILGGVLPVVKHFPGHGISTVDSHGDLPVIESFDEESFSRHLAPFRAAIKAKAPAVMPAHILYPALDALYPVTLSDIFIRRLLREELGFTGLVVSDGLSMGALSKHYELEETLARCFELGIDVILVHSRYSVKQLIDIVAGLVENGLITEQQVNEGVYRVLAAKRKAGILGAGRHGSDGLLE